MSKKEYFCPTAEVVVPVISDIVLTSISNGDNFLDDNEFDED